MQVTTPQQQHQLQSEQLQLENRSGAVARSNNKSRNHPCQLPSGEHRIKGDTTAVNLPSSKEQKDNVDIGYVTFFPSSQEHEQTQQQVFGQQTSHANKTCEVPPNSFKTETAVVLQQQPPQVDSRASAQPLAKQQPMPQQPLNEVISHQLGPGTSNQKESANQGKQLKECSQRQRNESDHSSIEQTTATTNTQQSSNQNSTHAPTTMDFINHNNQLNIANQQSHQVVLPQQLNYKPLNVSILSHHNQTSNGMPAGGSVCLRSVSQNSQEQTQQQPINDDEFAPKVRNSRHQQVSSTIQGPTVNVARFTNSQERKNSGHLTPVRPRHDISCAQEIPKALRSGEESRNASLVNNDQQQQAPAPSFNSCEKAESRPVPATHQGKSSLPIQNSNEVNQAMNMLNGKQIRVTPRLQRKGASLDAAQRSNHFQGVIENPQNSALICEDDLVASPNSSYYQPRIIPNGQLPNQPNVNPLSYDQFNQVFSPKSPGRRKRQQTLHYADMMVSQGAQPAGGVQVTNCAAAPPQQNNQPGLNSQNSSVVNSVISINMHGVKGCDSSVLYDQNASSTSASKVRTQMNSITTTSEQLDVLTSPNVRFNQSHSRGRINRAALDFKELQIFNQNQNDATATESSANNRTAGAQSFSHQTYSQNPTTPQHSGVQRSSSSQWYQKVGQNLFSPNSVMTPPAMQPNHYQNMPLSQGNRYAYTPIQGHMPAPNNGNGFDPVQMYLNHGNLNQPQIIQQQPQSYSNRVARKMVVTNDNNIDLSTVATQQQVNMIHKYSAGTTPTQQYRSNTNTRDKTTFSQQMEISSRGGLSNGGLNTPMTSIFSDGTMERERAVFSPLAQINASNLSAPSGNQHLVPPNCGRIAIPASGSGAPTMSRRHEQEKDSITGNNRHEATFSPGCQSYFGSHASSSGVMSPQEGRRSGNQNSRRQNPIVKQHISKRQQTGALHGTMVLPDCFLQNQKNGSVSSANKASRPIAQPHQQANMMQERAHQTLSPKQMVKSKTTTPKPSCQSESFQTVMEDVINRGASSQVNVTAAAAEGKRRLEQSQV